MGVRALLQGFPYKLIEEIRKSPKKVFVVVQTWESRQPPQLYGHKSTGMFSP